MIAPTLTPFVILVSSRNKSELLNFSFQNGNILSVKMRISVDDVRVTKAYVLVTDDNTM